MAHDWRGRAALYQRPAALPCNAQIEMVTSCFFFVLLCCFAVLKYTQNRNLKTDLSLFRSHDGYEDVDGMLEARTEKYATQRKVFDNLGQGVLDNAFEGW